MDWALIETWKEMEVPLHIALRGIEKSFDSWESKPRKRTVKSLLYCQEEVEAQYAEWREARVGAASDSADQNGEGQPFSRSAIQEHLKQAHENLVAAHRHRSNNADDDLADALKRATALLGELETDLAETPSPDTRKLEQSLSGLERMLTDAARAVVPPTRLETLETEVKSQLQPYRKQMEAPVYQQTFENLLLKRLREEFRIPRLSLFYL